MAEAFEIKAKLRHLQITPQKVRLVVDAVRGKNAQEALDIRGAPGWQDVPVSDNPRNNVF